MRMPTDPPSADPNAGKLIGKCKEKDASQGPTFLMKDSWLPLSEGYLCMLTLE